MPQRAPVHPCAARPGDQRDLEKRAQERLKAALRDTTTAAYARQWGKPSEDKHRTPNPINTESGGRRSRFCVTQEGYAPSLGKTLLQVDVLAVGVEFKP